MFRPAIRTLIAFGRVQGEIRLKRLAAWENSTKKGGSPRFSSESNGRRLQITTSTGSGITSSQSGTSATQEFYLAASVSKVSIIMAMRYTSTQNLAAAALLSAEDALKKVEIRMSSSWLRNIWRSPSRFRESPRFLP